MTTTLVRTARCLEFASGAAGLTLRGDASLTDLFRARFKRHTAQVVVADGTVTVR